MKSIQIALAFIVCSMTMFGQDSTTAMLKLLVDKKEYNKVIEQYAPIGTNLSARSLYYVGLAYYMKEDDNNCIKWMDFSIAKSDTDAAPLYIKASTLNYMKKYAEAVPVFQSALALKADDAEIYSGLGDAYYHLEKLDLALDAYTKATLQKDCPDRPYSYIAQIYSHQKYKDKALEAFYIAKSKISKKSDSYLNALYNIGLLESLKGNHEKAGPAFLELLAIDSTDYQAHAKLIQVYYHLGEYAKAKPYKDRLYAVNQKGLLKDNLKDMFCFDQFKWTDYLVQVFERYESGNKNDIYNKHIFYVIDNAGKIVLKVQTEYSPISVELGGPKYLLCANKGSTHYNPGIGFNDDFKYDDLKARAIKLIEELMK